MNVRKFKKADIQKLPKERAIHSTQSDTNRKEKSDMPDGHTISTGDGLTLKDYIDNDDSISDAGAFLEAFNDVFREFLQDSLASAFNKEKENHIVSTENDFVTKCLEDLKALAGVSKDETDEAAISHAIFMAIYEEARIRYDNAVLATKAPRIEELSSKPDNYVMPNDPISNMLNDLVQTGIGIADNIKTA